PPTMRRRGTRPASRSPASPRAGRSDDSRRLHDGGIAAKPSDFGPVHDLHALAGQPLQRASQPRLEGRWKIVEGAVEKQRTSAGLGHGKDERCTRRLAVLVRKLRKSRHPGIALDRKPPGGAPADGLPLSVGQGGEELRGALAQRPEQGRTIAAREARRGVDELGGGIRPLLLAAQPAPDLVDLSLNFTGAAEAARGEAGHL